MADTENKHALLSPSKAARWMTCPGSIALESDIPDRQASSAAAEGTTAHELAELCLRTRDARPQAYAGRAMSNGGVVTDEMADYVEQYVQFVRGLACSTGDVVLVEQKLDISLITGEEDAQGTADAIVLARDELIVVDLKFGKGVFVDAADNYQLIIYAIAAAEQMAMLHDFGVVRCIIHQPRLGSVTEAVYTTAELAVLRAEVSSAAGVVWGELDKHSNGRTDLVLAPSEHACQWCRAKASCPALAGAVQTLTDIKFDPIPDEADNAEVLLLSTRRKMVGLVRKWCDAIEDEVERALKSGENVPGWKLVMGKKGNRAWLHEDIVEKTLKAAKLKKEEMFTQKLISPTAVAKLEKDGRFSERTWAKIEALIVSPEGRPVVVESTDKRPALDVQPVMFENLDA